MIVISPMPRLKVNCQGRRGTRLLPYLDRNAVESGALSESGVEQCVYMYIPKSTISSIGVLIDLQTSGVHVIRVV